MSEKKPTPQLGQPRGKTCPVCGKSTYSRDGIHPQCAVLQADAKRTDKLKAKGKQATKPKQSDWSKKKCPKCKAESHVRRKVCDCGHAFF